MYKSTFYCLKIGPKYRPRLIHGSKSEIKKLSGQISINPLLHGTSSDVFSLHNSSSLSLKALRLNKELIVAANKVVSPLDDSHISCFEVLLLINLALYHVSARTLFSMCFSKMLVARVFFWLLRAFTQQ